MSIGLSLVVVARRSGPRRGGRRGRPSIRSSRWNSRRAPPASIAWPLTASPSSVELEGDRVWSVRAASIAPRTAQAHRGDPLTPPPIFGASGGERAGRAAGESGSRACGTCSKVDLDRLRGDVELLGDLAVGEAVGGEVGDPPLRRRSATPTPPSASRRGRAPVAPSSVRTRSPSGPGAADARPARAPVERLAGVARLALRAGSRRPSSRERLARARAASSSARAARPTRVRCSTALSRSIVPEHPQDPPDGRRGAPLRAPARAPRATSADRLVGAVEAVERPRLVGAPVGVGRG